MTFLAGTARALALILWYGWLCWLIRLSFCAAQPRTVTCKYIYESKSGATQTAIALPHPHGFGLKDAYKIQLAFDGAPPP